ncbi:MAG: alpha/beta hydrolase [Spirochaetales bacterium]|nr:alpha/beta hydrolase [Spirochaetales bacterium]
MYQTVRDATLYYNEYGSGEKYILSSQMGFDLDETGWPMDLADEGFHVFTIQIRGYGKSTHVQEDLGGEWYNIWADDVYEFAQRQGIQKFFYTGQSHGAGIGWHLVLRHPQVLVGFAALVGGPHSRKGGETSPGRLETIRSAGDPEARKKSAEHTKMHFLAFAEKFALNPALKAEFEQKAEKAYREELQRTVEEVKINPRKPLSNLKTDEEVYQELSKINIPVLMINGQQDKMVPVTDIIWPIEVIKNSKCVIYHNAGHDVHYDCRDDVRREIALFASGLF